MKTYTQAEAIKIRDGRELRYGTIDTCYVVKRVAPGRWIVQRMQRTVGGRRMFDRERRRALLNRNRAA